jgi:hypothetical protein
MSSAMQYTLCYEFYLKNKYTLYLGTERVIEKIVKGMHSIVWQ